MDPQSSFDVVHLSGELDIGRRAELVAALNAARGRPAVLVDFSTVTYADSTVIAELLRFRNEANAKGRRVALLSGNPQFARLLEFAGLAHAFALFDDRGAALTYLAGTFSP